MKNIPDVHERDSIEPKELFEDQVLSVENVNPNLIPQTLTK